MFLRKIGRHQLAASFIEKPPSKPGSISSLSLLLFINNISNAVSYWIKKVIERYPL